MSLVGERVIRKESAGIGVINKGTAPVRSHAAETALGEGGSSQDVADEGLTPPVGIHADEDYRRHLARVLLERALS